MSLLQDVRFATRLLLKDRWFTLAAVAALALGIGVNAMVFTIVNAVLLRGIPFHDPERIMVVWTENRPAHVNRNGVSFEDFQDWRDQARSFSQLVAENDANVNVSDDDQAAERSVGTYISWNIFQMLGVQPLLGRDFRADDDVKGATPVVMLGYGLWQKRYGGDPSLIGRTIRVNTRAVTVIGVMPQGLQFPNNVELWIPFTVLPPASFTGRAGRGFNVMGRLTPGVSVEQARAEARQLLAQMARGINPVKEKKKAAARSVTLDEAWTLYRQALVDNNRSAQTVEGYAGNLKYLAGWMNRPLGEISRRK